jgi:hypothetical protein
VEWRTKEKVKGVITVVELCSESEVGALLPCLQFLPLEVNEQTKNAVKVQRVGCYSLLLEYSLTAVSRR